MDRVLDKYDKRQGSLMWDSLSPASIELRLLYIELERLYRNSYADTADRENLIKLAVERGINPFPATNARLKAEFNVLVPIGSRFSHEELNYKVESLISDAHKTYQVMVESPGEIGNKYQTGRLIPVDTITGLSKAELVNLIIPGEDEEDTEAFRERYMNTLRYWNYGGNITDYKTKVSEISGVGGVKVYPVHSGGGTVRIVFITSEYDVPTADMVNTVQQILDPIPYQQKGMGIAPIGHFVTVEGVSYDTINIGLNLTFEEGFTWANVELPVSNMIGLYFQELREKWASKKALPGDMEDAIVIRVSQIESRLLDIAGIKDAVDTTINGSASNYTLLQDKIPKLGVISP